LAESGPRLAFGSSATPDTVLAPDVAFDRADRLPPSESRGFYRGAPDLAIEVLSPDDRPSDVSSKVRDYRAAGAPMVVTIDPDARTVTIHRPGVAAEILDEAGTLDFDPVVSGFRLSLAVLFE
jgi:Uma2 family endonuclease